MNSWQIILIPLCLVIIGFVRQVLILRKKHQRIQLAENFLERFLSWFNDGAKDQGTYNWLIQNSAIVQRLLGAGGIMAFRAPFGMFTSNNYPVILNMIPEIQRELRCNFSSGQTIDIYARTIDECLRRFLGTAEEQYQRDRSRIFNPLALLCGGVAWLMELPLYILNETKVITTGVRTGIVSGRAFSVLSGVVTLATLVATIMSIVMGWDHFVAVLTQSRN